MANELILMAEPRTVLGKQNKALRRQGLIPGVVYGPAVEGTVQVSVPRREFERFYQAHGHTSLVTLTWDGGSQQVFIKEVQVEPVKRAPLHIDFFAPNLRKELVSSVPVVLHHQSPNVEGLLNQVMAEVQVRSLPTAVPHQLNADVSQVIGIHDEFRAGQLLMPEGVSLVTDPEAVIAAVVPTYSPEAEEAEAAAEAEVPAAGEAASEAEGEESESAAAAES